MRMQLWLFALSFSFFSSGGVSAQTQSATNLTATATTTATATPSPILQPGALPPCALSCQNLKNAELICEPNTAAGVFATNQTAYHDCFCQSNLTAPFATSPNGPCDVECPVQSDRVKIQDWYTGYCNLKAVTSSSSAAAATPTSTTSSQASKKRRNGLSKGATIGVAVGASVAMILLALAIYIPLIKSATFAVRHKIPPPVIEDDREKHAGEVDERRNNPVEGQTNERRRRSGSDSDATNVQVDFKQ
jgi:hypothetical protein